MKFFIDDIEIKTVLSGAFLEGSLNLVSRSASFSYVFSLDNPNFPKYNVKKGSNVKIKDDNNENIFQGFVYSIDYEPNGNVVSIKALDFLYLYLDKKVTGRFRGTFLSIIRGFLEKNYSIHEILKNLKNIINTVSFGNLSVYDILRFSVSLIYGKNCKIYMDGNLKIKVLNYLLNSPIATINTNDILYSSYSLSFDGNKGMIKAFDNKNIVAGSVVKILDEKNNIESDFIVQSDRHMYEEINTMTLQLKERKII